MKPHADWFFQARIQQDANGNISLDQHRYAKSVVGQYLPTASPTPSPTDLRKFASPLPTNMVWTKANSSKTNTDVVDLETEYGFRFIEAVGSLNFFSNTAYEELFAIRKACKHMHLPGRLHFQALLHFPLLFPPGFDLLPRCYQVAACHDVPPRGRSRCCRSKLRLVLRFITRQL